MPYAEKRDGKLTGFWYGEVAVKKIRGTQTTFSTTSGERFRRRFETMKEAKGYEAYVKEVGQEPVNLKDAKLGGPTFSEWLKLARASKKWKSSRDPSGGHRLDYIEGRIGHLTVPAITTTVIDKLVEGLSKRPAQSGGGMLSDKTINRYLAAISSVIKYAREHPGAGQEPVACNAVFPWVKEKGGRIHWFSVAQEEVLVPWMMAKGWLVEALAFRVLCATGLRWSEFESLEVHQCQPEWVLLDETKTDTPRDVPMDEGLASELKAMVAARNLPKYGTTRTRLKEAVKACGYSPKLGLHNARHGAATRMIKRDVPLPVVQQWLGHKNINTTMKYIHVENSDLYAAMKKLSPQRGFSTENVSTGELVPFKKAI
jgi:integrase